MAEEETHIAEARLIEEAKMKAEQEEQARMKSEEEARLVKDAS